ncbi:hypothetical protein AAY473_028836 [Plecturocebus cupreus]
MGVRALLSPCVQQLWEKLWSQISCSDHENGSISVWASFVLPSSKTSHPLAEPKSKITHALRFTRDPMPGKGRQKDVNHEQPVHTDEQHVAVEALKDEKLTVLEVIWEDEDFDRQTLTAALGIPPIRSLTLVAHAGVQWCDLSLLQPPPSWVQLPVERALFGEQEKPTLGFGERAFESTVHSIPNRRRRIQVPVVH